MIITSIKKLIVDSATLSLGKPGSPEKEYPSIRPGKKWVKALVVKIIFIVLGRAFQSGSRHDLEIQREISVWPENFVIIMNVFPEGPRMVLEKIHDKLIYQGNKFIRSDLVINSLFTWLEYLWGCKGLVRTRIKPCCLHIMNFSARLK